MKDALPEYSGVRPQGVLHLNSRELLVGEARQHHFIAAGLVTAQEKLSTEETVFPNGTLRQESL